MSIRLCGIFICFSSYNNTTNIVIRMNIFNSNSLRVLWLHVHKKETFNVCTSKFGGSKWFPNFGSIPTAQSTDPILNLGR